MIHDLTLCDDARVTTQRNDIRKEALIESRAHMNKEGKCSEELHGQRIHDLTGNALAHGSHKA